MPKTPITLIKGNQVDENTDYRDALPANMFAVEENILGAKGYMLCWPGLTKIADVQGTDRGANFNERLGGHYRVSGRKFIQVNTDGTVTTIGDISGQDQVSMPYSFNTQAIIADSKMWLYSPTSGLVEVTDPDLGDPIDGVWIDGYYFLTDGENLYHTDISDETSIDPLKFATAEFSPDPTLGVAKTQNNQVMVFGRYSLEYFEDVATANFAFSRITSKALKIGIVATHAKCEINGTHFICGGRKNESIGIHQVGIGQAIKVSTREIDKILAQYTEVELADMRLEGRMEEGTTTLLVHLPNECLCYNISIAQTLGPKVAWSKLYTITYTEVDGVPEAIKHLDSPHRAINGVYDTNRGHWVYGDKYEALIGQLDHSVFTQYGKEQQWLLYTPLISMESQTVDEIEIETIPGNAANGDATVAVSLTYDGLFYSQEEWVLYGENLDRNQRFILRRLGDVDDWVGFQFRGLTSARMAFALMSVTHG